MENCQFWAVISFLSQLTAHCCDELIFKFLGKIFDLCVPTKASATLLQQALGNTAVITTANELVSVLSKICDFAAKKVKAFNHGEIDQHSIKMVLQLWPILGGKPIKITN